MAEGRQTPANARPGLLAHKRLPESLQTLNLKPYNSSIRHLPLTGKNCRRNENCSHPTCTPTSKTSKRKPQRYRAPLIFNKSLVTTDYEGSSSTPKGSLRGFNPSRNCSLGFFLVWQLCGAHGPSSPDYEITTRQVLILYRLH